MFLESKIPFRLESLKNCTNVSHIEDNKVLFNCPDYQLVGHVNNLNGSTVEISFVDNIEVSFSASIMFSNEKIEKVFLNNELVSGKESETIISIFSKVFNCYSFINFNEGFKKTTSDLVILGTVFSNLINSAFSLSQLSNPHVSKSNFQWIINNYEVSLEHIDKRNFSLSIHSVNHKNKLLFKITKNSGDVLLETSSSDIPIVLIKEYSLECYDGFSLLLCEFLLNIYFTYKFFNSYKVEKELVEEFSSFVKLFSTATKIFDLREIDFEKNISIKGLVVNFDFQNALNLNTDFSFYKNNSSYQNFSLKSNPFEFVKENEEEEPSRYDHFLSYYSTHTEDGDALNSILTSEEVSSLPFDELLMRLIKHPFVDKRINFELQNFKEKYDFVYKKTDMLFMISKFFVKNDVPEDFREFLLLMFESPSKEDFEQHFYLFVENYLKKINELYNHIENTLGERLDALINVVQNRSSVFQGRSNK